MKRFTKRTDLESLWEEDGDLKRMKVFFQAIDTTSEQNEQIKQSIKQKALAKITSEEEESWEVLPASDREKLFARILTKLFYRGFRGWKIGFSVIGLIALLFIGQRAMNTQWETSFLTGSTARSPQIADSVSQSAAQDSAGGPSTKGAPFTDFTAGSGTARNNSVAAPSAKSAAEAPAVPDQSLVPPADAGIPRKITYDLTLTLEVTTINDAVTKVSQKVQELGGYIAESQQSGTESQSSAHMTLKIPAAQLKGLQASFSAFGKVLDQSMVANDITNQYYDSQARLQTLEAEEKRYLEILEQAQTVDDVLKVENSLSDIRQQIEQLKTQLKLWDNQVDYSTVNLQLVTPQSPNVRVSNAWQPISWARTWQATKDAVLKTISTTWNALNYLVVGVGYVLPYLLIAVLGWIAYRVWRWQQHRG